MPRWRLWTLPTMPFSELICPKELIWMSTASLPSTILWTSPRRSSLRSPCECVYSVACWDFLKNSIIFTSFCKTNFPATLFFSQSDHLRGRSGGHLCHLCHVLRPSQLRPLPHPGEGHPGQAPAVCQRSQSSGVLDGQLPVGHGTVTQFGQCWFNVGQVNNFFLSGPSSRWITPSVQPWWWKPSCSLRRDVTPHQPTCIHLLPCLCFMGES